MSPHRNVPVPMCIRVGTKNEVHPETEDERPRLVFELEYLETLPKNVKVRLDKDSDFASIEPFCNLFIMRQFLVSVNIR